MTQIKRSAGQSAVAAAAYRAGEKLHSEYYGEDSDYTRKGGVICSEILLPSHAPPEYADRETLWNAVEKAERGKKAQLAYSFDIALQNEFSMQENIDLARQFLLDNFVSRGMVVDFAVHQPDKEDGGISNPHFHVMCPIRPIEPNGRWGNKQRREYVLDEHGERVLDEAGNYVFNAVPTTDWGKPETLEAWRRAWAEMCNAKFAEKGLDCRIDHRSAGKTNRPRQQNTDEQNYQHMERYCFRVLLDYYRLLCRWKEDYAPQTPEDGYHPHFVEALQKLSLIAYLLDELLGGDMQARASVVIEYGEEVRKLEQRMAELAAADEAADQNAGGQYSIADEH